MTIELVYRAQSAADARHFVRDALINAPAGAIDAAELLTSEVVTNAMDHARSAGAVIALAIEGPAVRIEVQDNSLEPPQVAHSDPLVPGGYGMAIVDQVATRWGIEERGEGKVVWFELSLRTDDGDLVRPGLPFVAADDPAFDTATDDSLVVDLR